MSSKKDLTGFLTNKDDLTKLKVNSIVLAGPTEEEEEIMALKDFEIDLSQPLTDKDIKVLKGSDGTTPSDVLEICRLVHFLNGNVDILNPKSVLVAANTLLARSIENEGSSMREVLKHFSL